MDFIERPGAGYSQSEGSGAKFEVYLGRATAARALRVELNRNKQIIIKSSLLTLKKTALEVLK